MISIDDLDHAVVFNRRCEEASSASQKLAGYRYPGSESKEAILPHEHTFCCIDSLNYQVTDVFVDAADSHDVPKASASGVGRQCRPHPIQLHIYLQRGCAVQRLEQPQHSLSSVVEMASFVKLRLTDTLLLRVVAGDNACCGSPVD